MSGTRKVDVNVDDDVSGYDVSRPQCTALRETPLHLAISNRHLHCVAQPLEEFPVKTAPMARNCPPKVCQAVCLLCQGVSRCLYVGELVSKFTRPNDCWKMELTHTCRMATAIRLYMWLAAWATWTTWTTWISGSVLD